MTLLQEQFIQQLPANGYNAAKTARAVGYSPNTANKNIHHLLRTSKGFREYFTEDSVKKDILRVKKLVLKEKDYTNFLRATELQSKILGMQVDKSEVTNKNPEKIVVAYGVNISKSE